MYISMHAANAAIARAELLKSQPATTIANSIWMRISEVPAFRSQLEERRYTFDVELTWQLLRHGTEITSVPVDWCERPGSHLRADSVLAMFRSLRALRRRLGNWHQR